MFIFLLFVCNLQFIYIFVYLEFSLSFNILLELCYRKKSHCFVYAYKMVQCGPVWSGVVISQTPKVSGR